MLADSCWWVLNVEDHLVELLHLVQVGHFWVFDIRGAELLYELLRQQSHIEIVGHVAI